VIRRTEEQGFPKTLETFENHDGGQEAYFVRKKRELGLNSRGSSPSLSLSSPSDSPAATSLIRLNSSNNRSLFSRSEEEA